MRRQGRQCRFSPRSDQTRVKTISVRLDWDLNEITDSSLVHIMRMNCVYLKYMQIRVRITTHFACSPTCTCLNEIMTVMMMRLQNDGRAKFIQSLVPPMLVHLIKGLVSPLAQTMCNLRVRSGTWCN